MISERAGAGAVGDAAAPATAKMEVRRLGRALVLPGGEEQVALVTLRAIIGILKYLAGLIERRASLWKASRAADAS
jgi:hypothetical protein